MASWVYPQFKLSTPEGEVGCSAECSSDHQGNGVMQFFPPADRNGEILEDYQIQAIEQLRSDFQQDTGSAIQNASVFWGHGDIDLQQIDVGFDEAGKVSYELDTGKTQTIDQASDRAQQLHEADYAHQQEVAGHNVERDPDPGPGR